MRTDPKAEEVRGIVEEVFAGFLRKERRKSAGRRSRATNRVADRFPRLYQPRNEALPIDDGANDATGRPAGEIAETILIDEGRYVARSYRTDGYLAMWLVALGILQFYDEKGRMLATINLFESLRPQRMTA
jgi:hypothetical protein